MLWPTLWTVRIACLCYGLALAAWLTRNRRAAEVLWTLGFGFYFAHLLSAFAFQHDWSHGAAYESTARQTAELFRIYWGGGLYFNYAFTAVWAADVLWLWANPESYRARRRWIDVAVHSFLAFMFFNATVVFGSGWVRWLGLAGTVVLPALLSRRSVRRRAAMRR